MACPKMGVKELWKGTFRKTDTLVSLKTILL